MSSFELTNILFLCKKYNKYHYTYTNSRYHAWNRSWIKGTTSSFKKIKKIAIENNKNRILEDCHPTLDIECAHHLYEKKKQKLETKRKKLNKKSKKVIFKFIITLFIGIISAIVSGIFLNKFF